MTGLSPLGFERKRLPEIKADIEARLRDAFGQDIDLRPESVFGQLVGTLVLPIAELWEEAENVYLSQDPDFAEGFSLDAVAVLTGTTRLPATPTTVVAAVLGDFATAIPAGSEAQNSATGATYLLQTGVAIGSQNLLRMVITVGEVANSTAYDVVIDGDSYDITSGGAATASTILGDLRDALEYAEAVTADLDGETLVITAEDGETAFTGTVSANLTVAEYWSRSLWEAQEPGEQILPVGALDTVQTPLAGWGGVENLVPGLTGSDIESDQALRLRRRRSVAFPATGVIDAIYARLAQLVGVVDVVVLENTGTVTDGNGLPPQHIWAVVLGGDDDEIAETIFAIRAAGIGMQGDTVVPVTSLSGQAYDVRFDRPDPVDVWISIELEKTGDYPLDGDDAIKEAILAYFDSAVGIGDDLRYSRLYTPINSVPGHEVTDLRIGTAPAPSGTESIAIAIDEIARTDLANIVITEAA